MEIKKRFKMYKSGKLWCTMALAGVMLGLSLGTVSGHADAVNSNDASATTASLVQEPQADKDNVVNNSTQTHSQNDKGTNLSFNSDPKVNTSVEANSSERPAGNATLPKGASTPQNEVASNKSDPANNQNQTGWQKNSSGQDIYYQNGSVSQVRNYVELPTIPNTNVKDSQSWYLMENGVALSGAQQWQGSMYYFDPITHLRVDNNYVVPAGQKVGYLLGQGGRALSGVQKWQGTYYYFDPATYKLLDHQDYVQSQWGLWYMVGSNGAVMSGPVSWQGSVYYFDPMTYLRQSNTYAVPAGQCVGYLLGADGRALSGVQKWQGTYYYFDPATYKLLDHQDYVQSQWGMWYMIGSNGAVMSGLVNWQGSRYYFDPNTYLKVSSDYVVPAGQSTGYLLGADGKVLTGFQMWQGTEYYFSPVTGKLVVDGVAEGNYYADGSGRLHQASSPQELFLMSIKGAAISGWAQYGVLPSVTAAQAILESGWGQSALATQGHNLFGIKGDYYGQYVVMRTAEYGPNGYYYINAAFRKYPSNYESILDHGNFLASRSWYHNLINQRDYRTVTWDLQADGYATDPNYSNSLNNIIQQYGLDDWDREAFA